MAIEEEDDLLQGKVVQASIGMPKPLWDALDREVVLLRKKSRAALVTEMVHEAVLKLRETREKAKK